MKPRIKIPVDRNIIISNHSPYNEKITKKLIMKALENMTDDEEATDFRTSSGFEDAMGWGVSDDEKQVWYKRTTLTVRSYRDETDEEYFKRMKNDEDMAFLAKEKERLDYLRLKAKFEP